MKAQELVDKLNALGGSKVRLSRPGDPELEQLQISTEPTLIKSKARLTKEIKDLQDQPPDEEQLRLHLKMEEWLKDYVTNVNPPMNKRSRRPKTKKPR